MRAQRVGSSASKSEPTPKSQPEANPKSEKSEHDTSSTVVIKTSLGDIVVALNPDKAPKSTANFLAYTDAKFYDQTVFHRVIKGFMIQGGGFWEQGGRLVKKDTRPAIANEGKNGLKE